MFDTQIRRIIDPILNRIAKRLATAGLNANGMTAIGAAFGAACFAALAFQHYPAALCLMLCGRLCDGLDGAIARQSPQGTSDLGGFYDIVSDMLFYAGFVFFFTFGTAEHALPAAFLIFSFMGTSSSFLAYGIIAAKRGVIEKPEHKDKSFFYLGGLTEGTETIFAFILMCLLPAYFTVIAMTFGALCWLTTGSRILQAKKDFSD